MTGQPMDRASVAAVIAADKATTEAATEGPWKVEIDVDCDYGPAAAIRNVCGPFVTGEDGTIYPLSVPDAEFIAAARSRWPVYIAAIEAVTALHYPAYNSTEADGSRPRLCGECYGKEGVHPCGCWYPKDYEPVCGTCHTGGNKSAAAPWPCPTAAALAVLAPSTPNKEQQ